MTRTKEVKFSISSEQRINLSVRRSSLFKRCNKSMVAPNNQDFAFTLSKIAVFLVLWRPIYVPLGKSQPSSEARKILNIVVQLGGHNTILSWRKHKSK